MQTRPFHLAGCFFIAAGSLSSMTCVCASSQPSSEQEPASEDRSQPQLSVTSSVVSNPPERGEPTRLLGGSDFICAERHEADVACFGALLLTGELQSSDPNAALGNEAKTEAPVTLSGWRALMVAAAPYSRCMLDREKRLMCWGAGLADDEALVTAPTAIGSLATARHVDVGSLSCAVDRSGQVSCWGYSPCGDREDGSTWHAPRNVEGLQGIVAVGVGDKLACALEHSGGVKCWGPETSREGCKGPPATVEGISRAVQLVVGQDAACALTESGTVRCWGAGESGLLRIQQPPASARRAVDVPVDEVVKLAGSEDSICALQASGTIWCWGVGIHGRGPDAAATKVPGIGNAIDVVVGDDYGCALLADRDIECFGKQIDAYRKRGWPMPFAEKGRCVNAPVFELQSETK